MHVFPRNDTYPHVTEGWDCPCDPKVEWTDGDHLVVHSAWDGRD